MYVIWLKKQYTTYVNINTIIIATLVGSMFGLGIIILGSNDNIVGRYVVNDKSLCITTDNKSICQTINGGTCIICPFENVNTISYNINVYPIIMIVLSCLILMLIFLAAPWILRNTYTIPTAVINNTDNMQGYSEV